MTFNIDRRSLMLLGGYGLGLLALPDGRAMAETIITGSRLMRGFTHGVASGEPGPDSVLLWTRCFEPDNKPVKVIVEVAETGDFAKIVAGGQMTTGPWRDYTAKITVDGLEPGRWYYYRFIGPDGTRSMTGRTRTLPIGRVKQFGIAVFSCSNIGFGYFNAYEHAASRDDIDLALHMGDYIYEYGQGGYDLKGFERVLEIQPEQEIISLTDYRMRYGAYRRDRELQKLHASVPMIVNTDDHEGANDAWEGGAQNHQGDKEGDWSLRRNAAMQAWREWMPVGEQPWKSYDIGDLATYFRTDSRMVARSRPDALGEILAGKTSPADIESALISYRDGAWTDPAMTMFGTEQESWLSHALRTSTRARKSWQLLGSGTNVGTSSTPLESMDWLKPGVSERVRGYVGNGIAASKARLPNNLDNWGGYPAARARMLRAAQSVGANLVVISGDSHNAWAWDLAQDGKPAGVEFGGHSVSSPGYENSVAVDPATVARGVMAASPELKWADTSHRGYMKLTVTPDRVSSDFVMMESVLSRGIATVPGKTLSVRKGKRVLEGV